MKPPSMPSIRARVLLDRYRSLDSLDEGNKARLVVIFRGREIVHPSFFQCEAWTSRMSCRRPNMQNIPKRAGKEVRSILVPREGHAFVIYDYESIEVRLLAHYLGDAGFQQLIEDGHDPHAWMATNIWGGAMEDFVKDAVIPGPEDIVLESYANSDLHRLVERLSQVRRSGTLDYLRPDGKSQVSVEYDGTKVIRVDAVVVSSQHSPDVSQDKMREDITSKIINASIPANLMDKNTKIYVNPTGRFVVGGPHGDAGVTGRKIIVDTYGGYAPHGGGAFSGKDPTKVDRSAAYAARYLAKNIVAAGLAGRCTLQLAYAIGVARPLSIYIDTHGTGNVPEDKLEQAVAEAMDLTPRGIRKHLDLNKPIYARTSSYGHFGRTPDNEGGFSWEKTDLADALKRAV